MQPKQLQNDTQSPKESRPPTHSPLDGQTIRTKWATQVLLIEYCLPRLLTQLISSTEVSIASNIIALLNLLTKVVLIDITITVANNGMYTAKLLPTG